MAAAPHVGSSGKVRRSAESASQLAGPDDYRLATLYFSAAYFSTAQAIEIDALRYAIDEFSGASGRRDWLLSAWLAAAGCVVNAPGHTAQFLKPTRPEIEERVKRQWRRSVWEAFIRQLEDIHPLGDRDWRSRNQIVTKDALDLIRSRRIDDVQAVYADPPYTEDHYSRFYHVYETLYLYDFPVSSGSGRYRGDRYFTPFSHVGAVDAAFRTLIGELAERAKPLVLSYPESGVLTKAGGNLRALLSEHYGAIREIKIKTNHSTLGGSSGSNQKVTLEKVYVCKP